MESILTLYDFQKQFPTEDACFEFFCRLRWPDGFRCPVCGNETYYFLPDHRRFECKACARQTSVTAGTVFHRLRHPFSVLVWALYLVATTKKGISAMELQRKLGLRSYESAWLLLQKIRHAMSPHGYFKLSGEVEVDETFVGGSRKGKRGRGADGKTLVAIAVETKGKNMGRARLHQIESASREELHEFIQAQVAPGTLVHTDGLHAYRNLTGYQHEPQTKTKENPDVLLRVHIVIANLKMWLRGTYNRLPSKHLQRYMESSPFASTAEENSPPFSRSWRFVALLLLLSPLLT